MLGRITTDNGGPDVHYALHLRALLCSQLACIRVLRCWDDCMHRCISGTCTGR